MSSPGEHPARVHNDDLYASVSEDEHTVVTVGVSEPELVLHDTPAMAPALLEL
jgi:hypothetical protein